MVKESIADLGLTPYAVCGLLSFFGIYALVAVWSMTRLYKQVSGWASLPLNDEAGRVSPDTLDVEFSDLLDDDLEDSLEDHECVRCGDCECSKSNEKNFVSIN